MQVSPVCRICLESEGVFEGPEEAAARRALIREVVGLYFARRRLQLERDLGLASGLDHAVRLAEIEAVLDAITGGWFGDTMGA